MNQNTLLKIYMSRYNNYFDDIYFIYVTIETIYK